MNSALTVLVILAAVSVAVGLVYVVRARTRRERLTATTGVLLTVLIWGGPATLWQCGEDDCRGLVPGYFVALGLTVVALVALSWGGRT